MTLACEQLTIAAAVVECGDVYAACLRLAESLPAIVRQIEQHPPQSAASLQQSEAELCAAIGLVERQAPDRIPALYVALMRWRGVPGVAAWWTFRPWMEITAALRRQVSAGSVLAMDLVLNLVASGAAAPLGTPAHWRGAWAAQQLVPFLPGLGRQSAA